MKSLCAKAREILVQEGNVQIVDAPVTVSLIFVGDDEVDFVGVWRYSWPVLRFDGIVQSGW